MCRQPSRAEEKNEIPRRKGAECDRAVAQTGGAKEWNPHGHVVPTEGQCDHERRDRATTILLVGRPSMTPRVDGEAEGCDAQQTDPAHGDDVQEGAHTRRDDNQNGEGPGLGPAHSSVPRRFGQDKLRGKGKKIVDHRAQKRE